VGAVTGPELLDTYCCQGGASAGYAAAGFTVTGVDIDPQPRYPYRFHRADALVFLRERMQWIRDTFTAIHASPPCQGHSRTQRIWDRQWPDLVARTRDLLDEIGLPWVMENVEGAPLRNPVVLCGAMFGLRTYRHRLFESGGGLVIPVPEHPVHAVPSRKMGRRPEPGDMIHAVGNFSGVDEVRRNWGAEWMNRDGLREALPPSYTRYIGEHMMKELVK
jgi:DNA (cytosine-5)-methyltransferase 1